jgi:hypothetical protein
MAKKDEVLEKLTYKGQCADNSHRVYYTLTDEPKDMAIHRIANVLSGVIEKLVEKDLLTEDELDEILLRCRG